MLADVQGQGLCQGVGQGLWPGPTILVRALAKALPQCWPERWQLPWPGLSLANALASAFGQGLAGALPWPGS